MADKIVVLNGGRVEQIGSPLELYDRPRNTFVAGFIGSPAMNLIDGEVAEIAGGTATVKVASTTVSLPATEGLAAGQAVRLGIRPEHLSLAETGLEAVVRVVEPTGSEIHVVFQFQDQELTAIFRDRHELSPGQRVHLDIDAGHAHLFDRESGARLD